MSVNVCKVTEFLLHGMSSLLLESLQERLGLSIDAISSLKLLGHKEDAGESQKEVHSEGVV